MPSTSIATGWLSIGGPLRSGGFTESPWVMDGVVTTVVMMKTCAFCLLPRLQPLETPCGESGEDRTQEHEPHEHECPCPGLTMPVLVRRDCVVEDLNSQGRDRLAQRG